MDRRSENIAQRGRIIGMSESGRSPNEIAVELGLSRATVYRWLKRWEEEGSLADKPKPGPARKTSAAEDQLILNVVQEHPFTNAVAVRDRVQLGVSAQTIRRRCHEAGIHHRTPAKKLKLTDRHRELRLHFAQEYVNMGMDYWGRVIFSDEKTFSSTSHGRLHCWRLDNTRYARRNIFEEARSGHVTANVWGWIGLSGVGEVTKIEGRFTADQYLEILEEVMLPSVRAYALPYPETIYFMQDNCPIHTARVVERWFRDQRHIELLPWPSNSCDLNPIENVWANIVNVWEPAEERASQQLMLHMQNEWEVLRRTPQVIYNHVASVPERLRGVITSNGGWTRF